MNGTICRYLTQIDRVNGTELIIPDDIKISKYVQSILVYAVATYDHVLPEYNKEYTLLEFADLIERHYDQNDLHNCEVVRVLRLVTL